MGVIVYWMYGTVNVFVKKHMSSWLLGTEGEHKSFLTETYLIRLATEHK